MGNRWYVSLGGQEVGPLSDTGLERMIQGGRIEGDALVRNGLAGEWTAAREVEPILAARPGRRRPGEEAIEAARRAKLLEQLEATRQPPSSVHPSAPAAVVAPAYSAAPTVSPVAPAIADTVRPDALVDTLPAPDDLPLASAQPSAAAASAVTASAAAPPLAAYPVTPAPAPAPRRRLSPIKIALVAGLLAIVGAICAAVWFSLGGGLSSNGSPAPTQPAAVDPQLAALQQQAEQLRRELAEAKQQLDAQPKPGEAPVAPSMAEASAAADRGPGPDVDAKPAASEPAAKFNPAPRAVDLEAERKRLAEMIATERAESDERERLRAFLEQFKEDTKLEFESQLEGAYRKHLPQATGETANLGLEEIARQGEHIKQTRETRQKEAEKRLAETNRAAEEAQYYQAIELARKYAMLADLDRMPEVVGLLRELDRTHPFTVLGTLAAMPAEALREIVAEQKLPADWPTPAHNPAAAEAARKSAIRLAPLALDLEAQTGYVARLLETRDEIDLKTRRKFLFLEEAAKLRDNGELSAPSVCRLIENFGIFDVDDLAPLIDDVLATDSRGKAEETTREYFDAVARGEIKPMTLRDLYRKCREVAGDAWPSDDRPHPLAGRWKGPSNWELEIDPRRDAIVFHCASPKATFEQRICKIGPGYVIAYEKRDVAARRVATDPFRTEKYNSNDRAPEADDPLPGQAIAFTYYSLDQGGDALEIRRRLMPAFFVQENANQTFWEYISLPKEYREFRAAYRRTKE